MKNSQYINQFSINISEIARISFSEVINDQSTDIVTVAMHVEALRVLSKFIDDTIAKHEANQMETKNTLS